MARLTDSTHSLSRIHSYSSSFIATRVQISMTSPLPSRNKLGDGGKKDSLQSALQHSRTSPDIRYQTASSEEPYVCEECVRLTTVLECEREELEMLRAQVKDLDKLTTTLQFTENQTLLSLRAMKHDPVRESLLMVDRSRQSVVDATMKTEGILGHIMPGEVYRTLEDNLELVSDEDRRNAAPLVLPEPKVPRMLVIENGFQDKKIDGGEESANILGGNVLFETKDSSYIIPHANETPEELAYYGVHLVPIGSLVSFQTPQVVPYTKMVVGERYVENYLLNEDLGGGFYLEYHSCPHYHQPLNDKAKGWLILGKFTEDERHIRLSAFKIPFGYGIYMPPTVLHCDAYLTGEYLVAYTAAKEFKTGIFRTKNMEVTSIRVWCEWSQKMWGLENEFKRSFFNASDKSAGEGPAGCARSLRESVQGARQRQNSTEYHNFDMKEIIEQIQSTDDYGNSRE